MEMTGEHKIPAPRKMVWDALHDPEILKDCIKGCQRLEKVSERALRASVLAKVGPVKATFDADVTIVDPVAPEKYTLVGEGKGGVAGFAKGSADVTLSDAGADTLLAYHVRASVGGKLAQLGSRLVDTTAKKYAADFFDTLSQKLSVAAVTPPVSPTAAKLEEGFSQMETAAAGGPVDAPRPEDRAARELEVASAKREWGSAVLWGILAFAVVILVLIALR
ncbi:MAG: carbon monoxide dehydrogenase subunit G [Pseudomonadota bacterium]